MAAVAISSIRDFLGDCQSAIPTAVSREAAESQVQDERLQWRKRWFAAVRDNYIEKMDQILKGMLEFEEQVKTRFASDFPDSPSSFQLQHFRLGVDVRDMVRIKMQSFDSYSRAGRNLLVAVGFCDHYFFLFCFQPAGSAETALSEACTRGHIEAVTFLLKNGADVSKVVEAQNFTAT